MKRECCTVKSLVGQTIGDLYAQIRFAYGDSQVEELLMPNGLYKV